MNKTGKATQISDFSYALPVDECVYTISTAQANNLDTLLWQAERENWEYMPQYVGGQKIVPYGNNNRLPVQIRDLMDENNLAPGILARQKGLLYGEGPFLRSLRFENGEITKEFKDDREIMAWLKDWDYLKYIDAAMTDYLYLKGFLTSSCSNAADGSPAKGRESQLWSLCLRKMPASNGPTPVVLRT